MDRARAAEAGRRIVRGVAVCTVLTSAVVIFTFNAVRGHERIVGQLVRLVLTCVLAFFLARGSAWARWVSVMLYGMAGLASAVGGAILASTSRTGWALLALGVVYLGCVLLLLVPASVRTFFAVARTEAGT